MDFKFNHLQITNEITTDSRINFGGNDTDLECVYAFNLCNLYHIYNRLIIKLIRDHEE